jgi:N-acetylated-alpha-linked acidic dipeptidase
MRSATASVFVGSLVAFTLHLSAQTAPTAPSWETRFRAIPDAANIGEYMKRLSARPHHVGTAYDKENADWMLGKFREWGWEAQLETFTVLFPTPKERVVELVAPTQFKALLEEPAIAKPALGSGWRAR